MIDRLGAPYRGQETWQIPLSRWWHNVAMVTNGMAARLRDEFVANETRRVKDLLAAATKRQDPVAARLYRHQLEPLLRVDTAGALAYHREAVERALADGLPVPETCWPNIRISKGSARPPVQLRHPRQQQPGQILRVVRVEEGDPVPVSPAQMPVQTLPAAEVGPFNEATGGGADVGQVGQQAARAGVGYPGKGRLRVEHSDRIQEEVCHEHLRDVRNPEDGRRSVGRR